MKGDKLKDQSRFCPTCGAKPGEPCLTATKVEMTLVHQRRLPFDRKNVKFPEIRRSKYRG